MLIGDMLFNRDSENRTGGCGADLELKEVSMKVYGDRLGPWQSRLVQPRLKEARRAWKAGLRQSTCRELQKSSARSKQRPPKMKKRRLRLLSSLLGLRRF